MTLAQGYLHMKIKTGFFQTPVGHFEPNFVFKLLGTKKLNYNGMMLVTVKTLQKYPFPVSFVLKETWYVASGTLVHCSLFK